MNICPVSDPALFKPNTPILGCCGNKFHKSTAGTWIWLWEPISEHLGTPRNQVCWWNNHPFNSWLLGVWSAPKCCADDLSHTEMLVSYNFACELWFYSYGGFCVWKLVTSSWHAIWGKFSKGTKSRTVDFFSFYLWSLSIFFSLQTRNE